MTLAEYVSDLPQDKWLYIGTARVQQGGGGGFMIISRKRDLDEHGWERFADRAVIETYNRKYKEPLGLCVLIQGTENGKFWTLDEQDRYLVSHDADKISYRVSSHSNRKQPIDLHLDLIMQMYESGMSQKHIGEIMGVGATTIHNRIKEAREKEQARQ